MSKHEAMDEETVAELLGVSTRQIRTYRSDGMPSTRDGRSHVYNWPQVLAWYVSYKASLDGLDTRDMGDDDEPQEGGEKAEDQYAANLRKTRADADLKQLALSKLRGEVIVIADVRRRLDRMFGNLRAQLLGLAPTLSTRIEGEATAADRENAIREAMENLCRELSTGVIAGQAEEPTTEQILEITAAAEPEYTEADANRILLAWLETHAWGLV